MFLLGRKDSNLRMAVPKTAALPLGDAPPWLKVSILEQLPDFFNWSLKNNSYLPGFKLIRILSTPIAFIAEKGV